MKFLEEITSEASLREAIGLPAERAVRKEIARLDEHCRALIEASPFVVLGTGDRAGRMDVSPKGDRPGFVQVLDDTTLAIPDRPGNRRADTFTNLLDNPGIGMLFVIPGKLETLRVNGRARIVRDAELRRRFCIEGKEPALVLVVDVEQVFIHCGKCMIRSRLWEAESWPENAKLPTHAQCLLAHAALGETIEQLQSSIDQSRRDNLY